MVCRLSDCMRVPEQWDVSSGPSVSFAGTPDNHGRTLAQLENARSVAAIRREMRHCDAVIVRQSRLGWLSAREAERRGIPWAAEVVGDAWGAYWNYGGIVGKLYAPYAWLQSRYWIGRADYAIYVTSMYLQRRYPCAGKCGSASDVEIPPVSGAVLRERLDRANAVRVDFAKPTVVGMIASLGNRYKGLSVALSAVRTLIDRGIKVELHVLGAGRHDYWRSHANRLGLGACLYLDGCLPSGEAVVKWLDGMDVYIQPSFVEGLPRALVEAMSRGLPSLGSTCGGIPELLPPACLHRPGDAEALAEQMTRLVNDAPWRVKQADRNYHEAQKYYADRIEVQRDAFWSNFRSNIESRRGAGVSVAG